MRTQSFDMSFSTLLLVRGRCAALFLALCSVLLAPGYRVQAQPTGIPRIAYLGATSLTANAARVEAFRQGLRELGYVEGKNIVIELRSAEGEQDRLPALVAELIRLKVDIIVSGGPSVTRAAKATTTTIPIVMGNDGDPVGTGFVASLARPGGNITGLSTLSPELAGKRLELLKEIVPRLSRLAVLGSSKEPANAQNLQEVELAAKAFKVRLQYLDVLSPKDIEIAFRAASKERADSVIALQNSVLRLSPSTGSGTCGKKPAPGGIPPSRICPRRRPYDLCPERHRLVSPCCDLRRQNSERQDASRSAGGTADEIRVRHQFESGEADRISNPTECAGAGGSGDQINFGFWIADFGLGTSESFNKKCW